MSAAKDSASTSIDLKVFDNIEQERESSDDFKSCIAFKRLIAALRYYQSLKTSNMQIYLLVL